jgi:hypothetical protein
MAIFTALATAILSTFAIEATTFAVAAVATVLEVGPTLGISSAEYVAADLESEA